jgi:exopolysaccharide biosynthesis polyprenyl glycosylphosphotransferase
VSDGSNATAAGRRSRTLARPRRRDRAALLIPQLAALGTDVDSGQSQRDFRLRRMLMAGDVVALILGMATWLPAARAHTGEHFLWGVVAIPLILVIFTFYGLYAAGLRRVGYSTVDDIPGLAHALLVTGVGLWLVFEAIAPQSVVFGEILVFASTSLVLALLFRVAMRHLGALTLGAERVLFVGSGPMTPILVRQVLAGPRHGMEPVGALTQPENERWPLPVQDLGSLSEVDAGTLLHAKRVDRVIVSAEGMEDDRLLELICLCRQLGIKISTLPSLSAMMGPAATIDHLEGITLIGLNTPSLARSSRALKRLMDIVGAGFLLLVTSPVWIVAAIAVRLDSPGPILFRQKRIGRGGQTFRLTKFRSMVVDAEAQRAALLAQSRQANWLDLEQDPRVTRVGRLLRLSSLDELPQLWNVLRGDMSLVGPRPLIEEEDRNVGGWARGRLNLTPGITGMWQVLGRAAIPFEQMIMLDYLYVANWSLWTDIKLILRTIPVVLTRRGAN